MSSTKSAPASSSLSIQSSHSPLPDVGTRNYTILKEVGDGSFGTVWFADWHSPLTLPPGTQPPGPSSRPEYQGKRIVAIKKMKKPFEGGWDECMKLKELKSLRTIPMHPFIIPLYDAFLHPTTRELHFVFECMEGNLYQLTKSRKGRPLAGGLIACIFEQTLLGLHHVHSCGYFHRDMKPENLLITTTGLTDYPHGSPFALPTAPPERDVAVIVKIADFGLARETRSSPPYTEYVSTRWYRAPEVLLRARDYSNPVDMWALGAILVETVTLKPLFPGTSEMDQVHRICEIMGDPKHHYGHDDKGRLRGGGQWLNGVALAEAVGFKFPDKAPMDFVQLFDMSSIPIQLVDCLHELLRYEPTARLTTLQCLTHPYFIDVAPRLIPPALSGAAMVNPALTNGGHLPRSNGHHPGVPHLLTPNSAHHQMSLDLPSISPQIVPTSYTHGAFPKARPPHILTPSNGLNDSVMSDPDGSGPAYTFPSTDGASPSPSAYPHRGAVAYLPPPLHLPHPDQMRRGSHGNEIYSQHAYDHNSPVITRDPSFLSLSPGHASSSEGLAPEPSPTSRNQLNPPMTHQKSRSRTLASVFSSSQSLKRTPSDRVPPDSQTGPSTIHIDPKKAKKEAEKAAKEEAKLEAQAKREAARRSAQERSRAVLQKQRLAQGSDMLTHLNPEFGGPIGPRKIIDKGKGRANLPPPMPQIVEDCSRVRNLLSHQLPRPSVAGSREPLPIERPIHYDLEHRRASYREDDRRFSVNSSNTMDSDPGPGGPSRNLTLHRSPSYGSGCSRLSVASSPNLASLYRASTPASTASSLDHQLVINMAGLTANERDGPAGLSNGTNHWSGPARGSEDGIRRSRSPSDPRFSPYPTRPSLPSISNFDFGPNGPPPFPSSTTTNNSNNNNRHDRHLSVSSGSPSVVSSQSISLVGSNIPLSPYSFPSSPPPPVNNHHHGNVESGLKTPLSLQQQQSQSLHQHQLQQQQQQQQPHQNQSHQLNGRDDEEMRQ
ncbi:kinase-like domain-containing protein [Melampsora americana]|nr:kinase-like domain-containing protein [Melampsora americana]